MPLLTLCLCSDGFNSGMVEERCNKQLEDLVVITGVKVI